MHNKRCENANPNSPCRCSCGGKYHGILVAHDTNNSHVRHINTSIGGELAKRIILLSGKSFRCTCGKKSVIRHFNAYPHGAGLVDADGKQWWLSWMCPKCHLQWSWQKLESKLKVIKLDDFY